MVAGRAACIDGHDDCSARSPATRAPVVVGWRTCAIRSTGTTLAASVTGFEVVGNPAQFKSCDLVAAADGPFDEALVKPAAGRFPRLVCGQVAIDGYTVGGVVRV